MNYFAFSSLLLGLSLHAVSAELTVSPKDAVSVAGKAAYFDCTTTMKDKPVHWSHYKVNDQGEQVVWAYGEFKGNYKGGFQLERNNLTGAFNLLITDVKEVDAGAYECQEDAGHGARGRAQLIVLHSEPMCKSNLTTNDVVVIGTNNCGITPEAVQLSCTVNYTGNSPPVLEWIRSGQTVPLTEGVNSTVTSGSLTTVLTVNGATSADGQSFVCRTTQSSASKELSCSSEVLRVWHAANDFSLFKKSLNDSIDCGGVKRESASFRSLCSDYKWTRYNAKGDPEFFSTDPSLQPQSPGLYRCQIDCTVKGNDKCSVNGMLVHVTSSVPSGTDPNATTKNEEETKMNTAFIVIVILLVVVVIAMVIGFLLYRRRQQQRGQKKKGQLLTQKTGTIQDLEAKLKNEQIKLAEYQSRVGIEYITKPVALREIKTRASRADDKSIKGIALLNNELYIISQKESEVEVYDATTLELRRSWSLEVLTSPEDASACQRNRCIYVSESNDNAKEILRIDPDGKLITRWRTGNEFGRLSVSHDGNVIVIIHDTSRLKVFSPDGREIQTYDLSQLDIKHPMHAVKLRTGKYVVIHGYLQDPVHRMCEVDFGANMITKSFGNEKGGGESKLSNPSYLAVDREGSLLVADASNGRVVLLGSNFQFKRDLVSKEDKIAIPTRVLIDELNGRLYVGDYKTKNRALHVFDIVKKQE